MNEYERSEHKPPSRLSTLVRQKMEHSAQDSDPAVTARLAAARHQALAQMGQQPPVRSRARATGFGLAASVAMVAVLVSFYTGNETPTGPAGEAKALEMLVAEEPLELYEDLEFYLWLEEQGMPADAPGQAG